MKKFLLIVFVFSFFAAFAQKQLTVESICRGYFYPERLDEIKSTNDGEFYTVIDDDKLVKYSYSNPNYKEIVFDFEKFGYDYIVDYQFNNLEDKILFCSYRKYNSIYRYSFEAVYYLADINKKTIHKVFDGQMIRLASFSPDGKNICFVYQNNLYLQTIDNLLVTQITQDGLPTKIINGMPDWVYEEEFEFTSGYTFSKDGKKLAFLRFDQSNVPSFSLDFYSSIIDNQSVYPNTYTYKYPKVGQNNSIVSVKVYDVDSKKVTDAPIDSSEEFYIPSIKWINNNELCICKLNRLQNTLELINFNSTTKQSNKFFTLKEKYYIEENVVKQLQFSSDSKFFVILSEKDNNRNIYTYDLNGKLINQVTKSYPEVVDLLGLSPDNKTVYYTLVGNNPNSVVVGKCDVTGKNPQIISPNKGTNSPEFSNNFKYFINCYSDVNTPYIYSVFDNKGKNIRVILDNENLKKSLKEYGEYQKEFFTFKGADNSDLNAFIIKPKNLDINKKYPILVVGYNGPNHNMVEDKWDFGWHQLLVQNGVLVACCDTRGTGRRGTQFRKQTYGKLGEMETFDLAAFAKYLRSLDFVDKDKIGIWGWSYGGFMAANAMMRTPDAFNLGISVAPVTNWLLYDDIYTERYMGLVENNFDGYNNNSPIKYAKNLKGKYLLIHGTCDDNVHLQNSLLLQEALIQANKDFTLMTYPNRNHGIYGGNTRIHLYNLMTNFILNNFKP